MKNSLVFFILFCASILAFGQSKILKHEAQLIIDNDLFTGDIEKDQYYSSGIYGIFRHLKDSSENAKIIRSYQLNHQMYTPSWIGEEILAFTDRPYAGVLSLSAANEYYFTNNHYLKAQIELGWMGPKALVGETQRIWHRWFGIAEPVGWKYQIEDSPVINLNFTHVNSYFVDESLEISGETNLRLGTTFNLMRYDLIIRLGKLLPINESAYLRGTLGKTNKKNADKSTIESYLFYSPGIEHVFYNATLEGNLFGKESIYTTPAIKWIWQHRLGAMFSWPVFDFGMTIYWRQKENIEATNHNYVGLSFNYRF